MRGEAGRTNLSPASLVWWRNRLNLRRDPAARHQVKNLTFSAEVQWFHLDQKYTVYEFEDREPCQLNVRVQRNC